MSVINTWITELATQASVFSNSYVLLSIFKDGWPRADRGVKQVLSCDRKFLCGTASLPMDNAHQGAPIHLKNFSYFPLTL